MILDTMTLEELILEIKTDFKEVRGRWNKFLPKFKKIIHDNQDPEIQRVVSLFLCRQQKGGKHCKTFVYSVFYLPGTTLGWHCDRWPGAPFSFAFL